MDPHHQLGPQACLRLLGRAVPLGQASGVCTLSLCPDSAALLSFRTSLNVPTETSALSSPALLPPGTGHP